MSNSYLVYHKILEQDQVLKIMDFDFCMKIGRKSTINDQEAEFKKRTEKFWEKARFFDRFMDQPNIVNLGDTDFVSNKYEDIEYKVPYFTVKYVKGLSLKELIHQKAPLELERVFKISESILSVLVDLHENDYVYRYIDPKQIIIEDDSDNTIFIKAALPKDTDIFSYTGINGKNIIIHKCLLNAILYFSSQPITSTKKEFIINAVICLFGVLLYEMVTGEPLFKRENPAEIIYCHLNESVPNVRDKNPDLPAGFEDIIFKAMAKDSKDRYRSALEFLNNLKELEEKLYDNTLEKEVNKVDKPKRNLSKYLIYVFGIIAIAAFIVINPFKSDEALEIQYKEYISSANKFIKSGEFENAIVFLNKAKEIKDADEIKQLFAAITDKQIEKMGKDFENLKAFLIGDAVKSEKVSKCGEFLNKHQNVPKNNETDSMISETNKFITQLEAEIRIDEQYRRHIDSVNKFIKSGDYSKATDSLNKAKKIKDTEEVERLSKIIAKKQEEESEYERINGGKESNTIKDQLNLKKYLDFKGKYPNSIHLTELKERLKGFDLKLPPEKYWERAIKKNKRGYYELTFSTENNSHLMIYIPGKKIWIDKYEVSWAQFRKFLKDAKIQFPPIEDDKFIRSGDEFPAVVTYGDAEKYCKKYGFRLPKIDEWEYAAGKGKFTYPWGNDSTEVQDVNGDWRANFDSLEGTVEKDGFEGTAPVKSFEKFSSPFGAVNMSGNVWEWVQGDALKGGGFYSSKEDLLIKSSKPGNSDKEGFRCVKFGK